MLSGEILVTGPAGQIAFPLARTWPRDNDVWGIARFGDPAERERVEAAGRHDPHAATSATGDFSDVPDDFDYVLHLATFRQRRPRLRLGHAGQRRGHPPAARALPRGPRPRW